MYHHLIEIGTLCHALFNTPLKFQIPLASSGCVLHAESTALHISWTSPSFLPSGKGTVACQSVHAHALCDNLDEMSSKYLCGVQDNEEHSGSTASNP